MSRVLVVDDDVDVVEACRLVLEKEGHEVATAGSRGEGMQAVADFSPDLIVLDVMMEEPDDGFTMAQDLRRDGCDVPIMLLTSVGKVTGMQYGKDDAVVPVDAFFEKPIDPATLVQKVAELLAQKGGA